MCSQQATGGVEAVDRFHGSDHVANYYLMEQKTELLSELEKLREELKSGKMASWYLIQLLLDKLNAMSGELKDGIGTYSTYVNRLSGDENKLAAALKNIEAYEAAHPKDKIPMSDVAAFKKAFNNVKSDLATLKSFVQSHPGPHGEWKQTYEDAQGNFNMISGEKWNGKTVGDMVEHNDDGDLQAAFKAWAKEYNQTGSGDQGPSGPFVDWENGAGQAEGLNNLIQDLSSDITNANNTLNQDAQIINSCNSIAQSGVKNTTDMYMFFIQHQVSNG